MDLCLSHNRITIHEVLRNVIGAEDIRLLFLVDGISFPECEKIVYTLILHAHLLPLQLGRYFSATLGVARPHFQFLYFFFLSRCVII